MTGVPPNFEQPETVPRRKKGWEPLAYHSEML